VVHGGRGPRRGGSRGVGGGRGEAGARRGKRSGEDGRSLGKELPLLLLLGLARCVRRGSSSFFLIVGECFANVQPRTSSSWAHIQGNLGKAMLGILRRAMLTACLSAHMVSGFSFHSPCVRLSGRPTALSRYRRAQATRSPLAISSTRCAGTGEEIASGAGADTIGQELKKLSRDGKTFLSGTRWLLKLGALTIPGEE